MWLLSNKKKLICNCLKVTKWDFLDNRRSTMTNPKMEVLLKVGWLPTLGYWEATVHTLD